jgi:signal transduction histidine kinase
MAKISQRLPVLLALVLMFGFGAGAWGQNAAHWSSFKMADGLSEPVFNTVTVTPQGQVIATSPGAPLAANLDGYSVSNFPAPPGNLGRIVEGFGGQRWALATGGLAEFEDGHWKVHFVPELESRLRSFMPGQIAIPQFMPTRTGCVLILVADQLAEFNAGNPGRATSRVCRRAADTRIGDFTGMVASRDGGLWISGAHGVARVPGPLKNLDTNTVWQEFAIPAAMNLNDLSAPVADPNGGLTLLAESADASQSLVVRFNAGEWTIIPAPGRSVIRAWLGPNGGLWAASGDALLEWDAARTNWEENVEESAGHIFDEASEPDGAFWLATADGLLRCALPIWCRPETLRDVDMPVSAMVPGGQDEIYFTSGHDLHLLAGNVLRTYPLPRQLGAASAAVRLYSLKDGALLTTDDGETALVRASDRTDAGGLAHLSMTSARPLGRLADGNLCVFRSELDEFDEFNGRTFAPLAGLSGFHGPTNDPAILFAARNGDYWLGGAQETWRCHGGQWQGFPTADAAAPENVVAFTELPSGQIWCATGNELWQFDGGGWIRSPNRFNHINALLSSRDGNIWLASNGGMFRFCNGVCMEYGPSEGVPNGPVTALGEDSHGRIWAATARGLMSFHPEADTDAPRTLIQRLDPDGHRLSEGDPVNLRLDGLDKWKYSRRSELLYSYQIDQLGWSAFNEDPSVTLPAPAAGRHYFQARAMDRNGNLDPSPAAIDFTIATPWFHETRLWVALSLGLSLALFFAGVAWHRHRALVRSHAAVELEIAQRTRELELATRELLHSQKMTALGTLAAGIAHDFNNILSIIKGSAQIIEDNLAQPEKIRTRVSRIKTVVQQGAEIVDAMLGFGRQAEMPAAPYDVNAVVTETLKLLGDRFQREVDIRFDRAENLPDVSVPREFIQQILLNFIFNAADAMADSKRITVASRRTANLPSGLVLNPVVSPAYVMISVRDQGVGIPPEIQGRIFEPFFTTKALSSRRGTGLGLSMVYELARKMGAGLAVHSVPSRGSEFTLILPAPTEGVAKMDGLAAPQSNLK